MARLERLPVNTGGLPGRFAVRADGSVGYLGNQFNSNFGLGVRIADRKKADLLKVLYIEGVAANPDAAVAAVLRSSARLRASTSSRMKGLVK